MDGDVASANGLGGQTSVALLMGENHDVGTEIHHCEFLNGHDLYLIGTNVSFHHNLIHNLNDEGMLLDGGLAAGVKIYQNVITNVLNAISFAGTCPLDAPPTDTLCVNTLGGSRYIYRNLIDLRGPTAGYRPRCSDMTKASCRDVWRFGNITKSNPPDGPYDLFQNTFLIYNQTGDQASFLHYRNTNPSPFPNYRRRSLNNIFIAVNLAEASEVPMAFLPPLTFPAITDGNDYFRIGSAKKKMFLLLEPCGLDKCEFIDLADLRRSCLPPQCTFEINGKDRDPHFKDIAADGVLRSTDDLRLSSSPNSTAIGGGAKLPEDLYILDPFRSELPDIGCYPLGSAPLQVGVDGRRSYPN
jgi:hypothetical protein